MEMSFNSHFSRAYFTLLDTYSLRLLCMYTLQYILMCYCSVYIHVWLICEVMKRGICFYVYSTFLYYTHVSAYLYRLSEILLCILLPEKEFSSPSLQTLLTDVMVWKVWLPLLKTLALPDNINATFISLVSLK